MSTNYLFCHLEIHKNKVYFTAIHWQVGCYINQMLE